MAVDETAMGDETETDPDDKAEEEEEAAAEEVAEESEEDEDASAAGGAADEEEEAADVTGAWAMRRICRSCAREQCNRANRDSK